MKNIGKILMLVVLTTFFTSCESVKSVFDVEVETTLSGNLARGKIAQIRKTGAEVVITACQQCVRTIKGRVRREKMDLEVMDISTVVARALLNV